MLVLGGAGPMDAAKRRPWIDWLHSANVQNTAVRDYTKWDDYPASTAAIPDSIARAHRIATAAPQGPTYVALDSELQEEQVDHAWPDLTPGVPQSRLAPPLEVIEDVAARLLAASRPLLVAGAPGRDPAMWAVLVELAELLGAGVVDTGARANFPSAHPLNVTGAVDPAAADVVVLLDVKDVGQHTGLLTKADRGARPRLAPGATLIDIGFGDIGISAWAADQGSWFTPDLPVVADTSVALPMLLERCRARLAGADGRGADRSAWRAELEQLSRMAREGWRARAAAPEPDGAISTPGLVAEVGAAIADHDWVLTAGTGNGWAPRLWDIDRPYRHPGRSLGTATQIGISLGVALAHKGTGRLVVDLQPDGDLLFDASALWVAAKYRLPMLVVMVNNRAYNNDWVHQKEMARVRSTPLERAAIGITIDDPAPDFATLARSFGWQSTGPVTRVEQIQPAVRAAADIVRETGRPALVDIVCRPEG
jgi:benzoylformate decarboxylase/acetolactate synthase-1/2/3 large subunit